MVQHVWACWRESPPIDPEHMLTICTLSWKIARKLYPDPLGDLSNCTYWNNVACGDLKFKKNAQIVMVALPGGDGLLDIA